LTRIPPGGIFTVVADQTQAKPVDPTLQQLKRIRGQLDGVIRMYEDERTCVDIVRQIIAARNSLTKVAQNVLLGEANRCTRQRDIQSLETVIAELFKY